MTASVILLLIIINSAITCAHAQWSLYDFDQYVFSLSTYNDDFGGRSTGIMTVENDKVINVSSTGRFSYIYVVTINEWFDEIKSMYDGINPCDDGYVDIYDNCQTLEVYYDDTYGYPERTIECSWGTQVCYTYSIDCFDPYHNGIKIGKSPSPCNYSPKFRNNSGINVWDEIKAKLIQQQAIFNSIHYNQYIYSAKISCECKMEKCTTTTKYISVNDDKIDDISFADNHINNCSQRNLYDSDKRTINDWFNVGIAYCEKYRHCHEKLIISTTTIYDECINKSLTVIYNDIYGNPIQMIFDGDKVWYFECFVPFNNNSTVKPIYADICNVTEEGEELELAPDEGLSADELLIAILIPLFCCVLILIGIDFYVLKKRKREDQKSGSNDTKEVYDDGIEDDKSEKGDIGIDVGFHHDGDKMNGTNLEIYGKDNNMNTNTESVTDEKQ